jgi:hypothetical protein
VISSLVPKLIFYGLLVLTLSFKVLVGTRQFVPRQDDETVRTYMATFLARQGFELDPTIAIQYPFTGSGRSGGCQLLIAEMVPQGWQRSIPRRVASDGDQVLFFFRGHKYKDQPVWLTLLSGYWNGLLHRRAAQAAMEQA